TVTFADGGNVTMDTGCNTARGDWKLDGNRLTIGPLATTLKACTSPEGVMEQETALVHALESAHTVDVAPGELVILDAKGRIALRATDGSARSRSRGGHGAGLRLDDQRGPVGHQQPGGDQGEAQDGHHVHRADDGGRHEQAEPAAAGGDEQHTENGGGDGE